MTPTPLASRTSSRPSSRALLLALLALAIAVPIALAAGTLDTGGPITGGTLNEAPVFRAASPDGSVVAFSTTESLVAADSDSEADLYVRRGTAPPKLLTPGDVTGPEFDINNTRVLANGVVLFVTALPLAGDSDTSTDIYLDPPGGDTFNLSFSSVAGTPPTPQSNIVTSADGSTIAFTTTERLLTTDDASGSSPDVYRATVSGDFALVTEGASQGTSTGINQDGTRIYWESGVQQAPETASDAGGVDLFYRDGAGPPQSPTAEYAGGGGEIATFAGQSPDGNTIVLRTKERFLPAQDTIDGSIDLYAFRSGSSPQLLTPPGSGTTALAQFVRACDGGSVVFTTSGNLGGDSDGGRLDVYRRTAAGTATRLSTGQELASGNADAAAVATSSDCSDAVWATDEKALATDTDSATDLYYARDGGQPTQVSAGPDGTVFPPPVTTLGTGLLFTAGGALTSDDGDGAADVFRWDKATGALSLVSSRGSGTPADQTLAASGKDAGVAIVRTTEALQDDGDAALDLYRYTIGGGSAPTGSSTPSPGPTTTATATPTASATAGPTPAPATGAIGKKGKLKLERRKKRITLGRTARCSVACSAAITVKLGRKRLARATVTVKANTTTTLRAKLPKKALKRLRRKRRLAFAITLKGAGKTLAKSSFKATVKP